MNYDVLQVKESNRMSNGKTDLTTKAYQEVRQTIFANDLKPGQKIPYRVMAKGLDMSLTPIIQALKHMEFMGLVEHTPNRGFVVKKATQKEIEEAFKLRIMIEPQLLSITMENMDKIGEKKIKLALDAYLDAPRSGNLKLRLIKDIHFHMTIAELSGQDLSISFLRHLFDLLYLRSGQGMILPRPFEDASENHIAIYDAIKKRDTKAAIEQLKMHLTHIYTNARDGINSDAEQNEQIVF